MPLLCTPQPEPKPDIDELIFGDADTIPSQR